MRVVAEQSTEEKGGRRWFLASVIGKLFFVLLNAVTMLVLIGRFFFPESTPRPSARFRAGRPDDYPFGKVSSRWLRKYRVWIVRQSREAGGALYVLRAVCTHLECAPIWESRTNRFRCPCHGSEFDIDGRVLSGPAPRALERFHIELGDDGKLVVDMSIVYRHEDGGWTKGGLLGGAFLTVPS